MTMIFRHFKGYLADDWRQKDSKKLSGREMYSPMDLGREVIYSRTRSFNRFCKYGLEHCDEASLKDDDNWQKNIRKYVEFAAKYFFVGCVLILDELSHSMRIVTENCFTNAYSGFAGKDSFYVLFNARPTIPSGDRNVVRIGYDEYGLMTDTQSVIVWDVDRYAELFPPDYTVWGMWHSSMRSLSRTEDNLIGIRNGKRVRLR